MISNYLKYSTATAMPCTLSANSAPAVWFDSLQGCATYHMVTYVKSKNLLLLCVAYNSNIILLLM